MATFKCREFDKDRGKPGRIEMPDGDWDTVEASDSEAAAESFAADLWEDNAGEITKFSIEVLSGDGSIERWSIQVEFEPTFILDLEETTTDS